MKKTIAFLLAFLLITSLGMAQNKPKNAFKVNPLSALIRTGSVFYETAVSDKSSIQLGVAYTGLKLDDVKFDGFAFTPEYRSYFKGEALNGLYVAPFARYQNYRVQDEENNKGTYESIGGGLMLGKQWMYDSGFALDLFFGPAFNSGKVKDQQGSESPTVSGTVDGFGLRVGVTIGFGF